jgi:hypothetical protein
MAAFSESGKGEGLRHDEVGVGEWSRYTMADLRVGDSTGEAIAPAYQDDR